jgi:mono/diheme cytochrome c family protein
MRAFVIAAVLVFAQAKTTQDGVYTAAQAKRGDTIYGVSCSSCHAADLAGSGQASSLTGKEFNAAWNGVPLSDLFERIRATMPADAPGTLTPVEVADVIAFILGKAGQPAGQTELAADPADLKAITFMAPQP